jgi:hypothetical protein
MGVTDNWYRVSLGNDKFILESDSGNGCVTL